MMTGNKNWTKEDHALYQQILEAYKTEANPINPRAMNSPYSEVQIKALNVVKDVLDQPGTASLNAVYDAVWKFTTLGSPAEKVAIAAAKAKASATAVKATIGLASYAEEVSSREAASVIGTRTDVDVGEILTPLSNIALKNAADPKKGHSR